jgi:multiple antibiotic resistance protein
LTAPLEFGLISFSSLIAMVDPIAVAPIFVQLTGPTAEKRKQTAIRACVVAGATLLVFALAGSVIFAFFGITVQAFQIVGGLLLTTTSIRVLQGGGEKEGHSEGSDPSVVPIAIPLIAGGGAISTVMVLAGQARGFGQQVALSSAILTVILLTFVTLRIAPRIVSRMGKGGQEIMSRLLALLTAVIGVQFIINGGTAVISEMVRSAG